METSEEKNLESQKGIKLLLFNFRLHRSWYTDWAIRNATC